MIPVATPTAKVPVKSLSQRLVVGDAGSVGLGLQNGQDEAEPDRERYEQEVEQGRRRELYAVGHNGICQRLHGHPSFNNSCPAGQPIGVVSGAVSML